MVWKWPQGKHKSFSQHASAYRHTYFYYIGLFAVVLPLLLLFFTDWFVPTFNLSGWFMVCIGLSMITQILVTLIPESGGKKSLYHRRFAFVSALLLIPPLVIIAMSESVSMFGRISSVVALITMFSIIVVLIAGRGKHKQLLWLQVGYFVAFFAAVLATTYRALLIVIGLIIIAYLGFMIARILRSVLVVKAVSKNKRPYSRAVDGTTQHIIVMGDSSMYGAGIISPEHTVGGLLAKKYPQASLETVAFNGARVRDLAQQFEQVAYRHYDLIVIGVGGNDIAQFSSYAKLRRELTTFLKQASKVSDQIILCHSGNIGNIGFFLFPLNHLFGYRSGKLSQLYSEVSASFSEVTDVIFYRPLHKDHYDKHTRKQFIASDGYHATDYANQYFFKLVWKGIQHPKKSPNTKIKT